MLPTTLNTNEVKDAAGAEIEFQRRFTDQSSLEFAKVGEAPYAPHRLLISHLESGVGIKLRRRSRIGFRIVHASDVDTALLVQTNGYVVLDSPIGAITTTAVPAKCLANLWSFCASLGASTTILYDGTGNGSVALLQGSL